MGLAAFVLLTAVVGGAVYWLERRADATAGTAMDEQDRYRFLERVRSQVEDLLWQPEGDPEPIRLVLTGRTDLVETPRERFAQRLAGRGEPVVVDTAFELAEGALLLTGAPGAGKSRLLAELAAVLLARAEQDPAQPVPVLVNVSS